MSKYLFFNVCSEVWGLVVCGTCIFCALMMSKEGALQKRHFFRLFICNGVLLLSDIISLLYDSTDYAYSFSIVMVANTVLFIASFLMLTLFTDYMCDEIAANTEGLRRTRNAIRFLCYGLMCLTLVNMFVPIFFRVSETSSYSRASFFWISQTAGCLVAIIDELLVIVYRRYLSRGKIIYFTIFIMFPLVAMALQICFFGISLVNVTTTFLLMLCFVGMMSESNKTIYEQRLALATKENELTESRAQMMLSQIQPHFLYNALNSIYYLCGKDPKLAQKAVGDFADYLRMNLDSLKTREKIPFAMELKHIQTYLWLEHLRFDDRLNVIYDIQCRDFMLPVLMVQPIVENAVKHGICARPEGGTVTLSTREEDGDVVICVSDDGVGFEPDAKKEDGRSHIGLQNVAQRVELEMKGTLQVESKPGCGTRITIRFPKGDNDEYRSGR